MDKVKKYESWKFGPIYRKIIFSIYVLKILNFKGRLTYIAALGGIKAETNLLHIMNKQFKSDERKVKKEKTSSKTSPRTPTARRTKTKIAFCVFIN